MTIDAQKPLVNGADADEQDALLDTMLLGMADRIKKTKNDALEEMLWRELELLAPAIRRQLLDEPRIRGYMLNAAGKNELRRDIVWKVLPDRVDFGAFDDGDGGYMPTPAIIKKVLPRDGFVIIGGQSRAGKTYMAINLAVCLATGRPFLGYKLKHKSAVIYGAAEGSGTIQPRLNAAKKHMGIDARLPIRVLRKMLFPTDEKEFFHYVCELQREIETHRHKTGLDHVTLFIDTAAAGFPMNDENSAAEISRLCTACRNIAVYCRVLVILVHHYGKDQTKGLRGSSAWTANADHVFGVLAERDPLTGESGARNIIMDKNRLQGGWEGPLTGFTLESVPMGKDEDGEDWSEAALVPSDFTRPERAAPAERRGRPSAGAQAFGEAFNECAIDANNEGRKRHVFGDGPVVPAVMLDRVKSEFRRRYAPDGDDTAEKKEALKKAWQRAKKELIPRVYRVEVDHGGIEWIWQLKAEQPVLPL